MNDERVIAYLLEELSPTEAAQFEEELFAHNEWPSELEEIEEDLICAYLQGELSIERRRRFEENYLRMKVRREKVALAKALLKCVDDSVSVPDVRSIRDPSPNWYQRAFTGWRVLTPGLRGSIVSVTAALIVVAVLFVIFRPQSPNTFLDITLTMSGQNRGEGGQNETIALPITKDAVRVTLKLPPAVQSATKIEVRLEDEEGRSTLLPITGRTADSLTVAIPKSMLKRNLYAIKLSVSRASGALEELPDSYALTVQ